MDELLDDRKPLSAAIVQEAKYAIERGDSLTPVQTALLIEHLQLQKRRFQKLQTLGRESLTEIQKREYDELAREISRYDGSG